MSVTGILTSMEIGKRYKLIDVEGYRQSQSYSPVVLPSLPTLLTEGVIVSKASPADSYWFTEGCALCFCRKEELKFFEEVVQEAKQQDLWPWDGIEDLEVGMVIKYQGIDFPVKYISDEGKEIVLDMNCSGLQVVNRSNVKAAKLSHKEQTLKEVMEAWKRQGLDFAHDIKGSHAPIENVFNIVYDVMKGEEV